MDGRTPSPNGPQPPLRAVSIYPRLDTAMDTNGECPKRAISDLQRQRESGVKRQFKSNQSNVEQL